MQHYAPGRLATARNTARRFFAHRDVSSSITGVNEDLINRFHVVLQALSSGYEINITRFEEFALATARRFVELYPWYYMPTTVHKILIHGAQIISSALLPIGQMSEEAQEYCIKLIKRYREDFSRKSNRRKTMEDVFCRLLVSSDPYITNLQKLPKKNISIVRGSRGVVESTRCCRIYLNFLRYCT